MTLPKPGARPKKPSAIGGRIDDIQDGLVIATLVDHSGWSYYAEIDLDRFADIDQPHCVPGALFHIKNPGPELKLRRKTVRGDE